MRRPRVGTTPLLVIVPAVEVRVGHDRLARHLVEGDVLRRKLRRAGDDERSGAMRSGYGQRPLQRLHAPSEPPITAAKRSMPRLVGKARLRLDPVFHRHHRKVRAPGLAGCRD